MVVSSSLQFCSQLQIGGNYSCIRRPKSSTGKARLHCISSTQLVKDAWNLYFLSKVKRPLSSTSSKCKRLVCRAALPGGGNEIPAVQKAVLILKRVSDSVSGNQCALQLGPAIGILAFALWGLQPLVLIFRNSVFQESDSNWKKSDTQYITTSYIQPFMLWLGTMLVCRAIEPLILPTEASRAIKQRLLYFVRSLSSVMSFAYCLSSLIQQLQKFFVETSDSSAARNMGYQFAGKAISMAVWVAAVSLFMELLGFSTQKWLTAGGLGTVLLTLAGREILTNFLSSMMIHTTRPFVLNEWIQTKIEGYEVSGTVEHVGWWSPTIIRGDDREAVHIPNHKFTVNVVRNLSQKTHWRIKTYFAISHLDVSKINYIVADMRKVIAKNPQVEQQKLHRRVFLENVDPENQALMIMVSCFVKTPHIQEYLCVKEGVILDLLRVISHHRARLATPIRSIQKVYTGSDIDNVPYTHPPDLANRVLLVDSSYKVGSNNRPKSPSTKSSETDEAVDSTNKPDPAIDAKHGATIPPNVGSLAKIDEVMSEAELADSKAGAGDTTAAASEKTPSTPLDTVKEMTLKHESEKSPARPMLEDNLVLGVALEGSKRTLPIEGMSSSDVEPKEPATHRDGNGPGLSAPPSTLKDSSSDEKKPSTPDGNPGEKES